MVDPLWMSVAVTGILVLVTICYVWINGRMLTQMQKEQKIRYLERRLEKLYYPIQKIVLPEAVLPPSEKYLPKMYKIFEGPVWNYQYLSSEKLRIYLKNLENIRSMKEPIAFVCCKEIQRIATDDISDILKDLDKLTK